MEEAYQIAKDKGFWDLKRDNGTMLMLMVSELAEAMEADRNINKEPFYEIKLSKDEFNSVCNTLTLNNSVCDLFMNKAKLINYKENFGEEFADTVIRIADFCKAENIDLEKAIEDKMEANKNRPYLHGGKKY